MRWRTDSARDVVGDRFVALGTSPIGGSPGDFAKRLQSDYDAVEQIVARTGMKAE